MDKLFNRLPEIMDASNSFNGMATFMIVVLAILGGLLFYLESVKIKMTIFFIFIILFAILLFSYKSMKQEDTTKVDYSQTYEAQIEKSLDKPLKNPKKIDNLGKPTYLATSPPVLHIDEQCSVNNPPLKCLWNQQ